MNIVETFKRPKWVNWNVRIRPFWFTSRVEVENRRRDEQQDEQHRNTYRRNCSGFPSELAAGLPLDVAAGSGNVGRQVRWGGKVRVDHVPRDSLGMLDRVVNKEALSRTRAFREFLLPAAFVFPHTLPIPHISNLW